jgi:DNA ligase-1
MLSASLDGVSLSDLRYPLLASPKLDGIRCIVWEGVAHSRNGKPLRNKFVQAWASKYHNLDGEIIVGDPTDRLCLNRTHAVMAFEGEPDFNLYLFDAPDHDGVFRDRLFDVTVQHIDEPRIIPVVHELVPNALELAIIEAKFLNQGYEGVMLRDPNGPHKNGYSTLKEGWLMKLKRFLDGEAVVTGLEEAMENRNTLRQDEMGYAKRSTFAENMYPKDMIGTLICQDKEWGELRVGPGVMTHNERIALWKNPKSIVGKVIHWRSFGYGVKDRPRFARFYGIREDQ